MDGRPVAHAHSRALGSVDDRRALLVQCQCARRRTQHPVRREREPPPETGGLDTGGLETRDSRAATGSPTRGAGGTYICTHVVRGQLHWGRRSGRRGRPRPRWTIHGPRSTVHEAANCPQAQAEAGERAEGGGRGEGRGARIRIRIQPADRPMCGFVGSGVVAGRMRIASIIHSSGRAAFCFCSRASSFERGFRASVSRLAVSCGFFAARAACAPAGRGTVAAAGGRVEGGRASGGSRLRGKGTARCAFCVLLARPWPAGLWIQGKIDVRMPSVRARLLARAA
ncbi:hypothetical protein C8Q80DRAFT_610198 [Daedaleopsis nitida]|nr:hypothetical protein C8Q80DRAFT_610198 [Daedaleopsis nitida]